MLLSRSLALLAVGVVTAAQDHGEVERGVGVVHDGTSGTTYARRHALVIGIDAYEDPAYPDLGYAAADARAVARILVERYGFAQEDVRLVLDEDATKPVLEEALEEWACDRGRIGAEDLFVVFFAGHGVTRDLGGRGKRGYLVPVDGRHDDGGDPSWASLVGMNDVEDVSEVIPAKHVLFVLDCCFGGLAVQRAAPPVAAGLSNRARQVITAGSTEQTVLDTGGGGHSVFTGALIDALEGGADLDGDRVVTFGELFNHVGRAVERKTEARQTPLQATFPDHEGGNVALFAPDVTPGGMTAAERLKALERTADERLDELERLADYILVQDLEREVDSLWPQSPEMVPRYRDWLFRAQDALERREQHEASVRQVRQEAYLSQVVAGQLEEGEGTEPVWEEVDRKLRWRFGTFQRLVEGLERLGATYADIEKRLEISRTLRQVSIDDHAAEWEQAIAAIAEHPLYGGMELAPQLGLVPLGPDPEWGLWEFAHVLTGLVPERDADGAIVRTWAMGLVFVLIPGGTFWMGAQASNPNGRNYDPQARGEEGPVHAVTLSAYFLSKYELTQGQWQRLTGANPSLCPAGFAYGGKMTTLLHPVEAVSWLDAMRELPRMGLGLPSEAQWEHAARAFGEAPWSSGPEPEALAPVANLADAFAQANGGFPSLAFESWSDGYALHAPVGSFWPNEFGLHDVHGNVSEWCLDGYAPGFYGRSPESDPVGPWDGAPSRVSRGGCFINDAAGVRSAFRDESAPSLVELTVGVRPARACSE